jgi:hypothetical protein
MKDPDSRNFTSNYLIVITNMKYRSLLIIALIFVIGTLGCKKEEDTQGPTVSILGKTSDRVLYPKQYVDPGATATDDVDGDVSSTVVAHNSIDYNNPNTNYDIYYTAKDKAGNEGSSGQRLVMLINLNTQFGATNGPVNYWETPDYKVSDTLIFNKFAGHTGAKIRAYMPSDSTFTIASQTVICGEPGAEVQRTFTGNGTLKYVRSGPSVRTTINVNFTQIENSVTTNGTLVYQN